MPIDPSILSAMLTGLPLDKEVQEKFKEMYFEFFVIGEDNDYFTRINIIIEKMDNFAKTLNEKSIKKTGKKFEFDAGAQDSLYKGLCAACNIPQLPFLSEKILSNFNEVLVYANSDGKEKTLTHNNLVRIASFARMISANNNTLSSYRSSSPIQELSETLITINKLYENKQDDHSKTRLNHIKSITDVLQQYNENNINVAQLNNELILIKNSVDSTRSLFVRFLNAIGINYNPSPLSVALGKLISSVNTLIKKTGSIAGAIDEQYKNAEVQDKNSEVQAPEIINNDSKIESKPATISSRPPITNIDQLLASFDSKRTNNAEHKVSLMTSSTENSILNPNFQPKNTTPPEDELRDDHKFITSFTREQEKFLSNLNRALQKFHTEFTVKLYEKNNKSFLPQSTFLSSQSHEKLRASQINAAISSLDNFLNSYPRNSETLNENLQTLKNTLDSLLINLENTKKNRRGHSTTIDMVQKIKSYIDSSIQQYKEISASKKPRLKM